jgi:hypothetical protein
LVGNPEVKKPLRRPSHKWKVNIIKDLRVIRWEGVDWIQLAQNRNLWAGSHEQGKETSGTITGEEFLDLLRAAYYQHHMDSAPWS